MKDGWVGFFCSSVGWGDRHQGFPHDDARDAAHGDGDDHDGARRLTVLDWLALFSKPTLPILLFRNHM